MKRTALYDEHIRLGARMIEFAGYLMPLQYKGIIEEHRAVRLSAGMFDVSHMGQIRIRSSDALDVVQYLTPNDASLLAPGKAQYSMMLKEDGNIIDDVIVYRLADDDFMMVVNASNKDKDFGWISSHLLANADVCDVSDDYAMIAVQGPKAGGILNEISTSNLLDIQPFGFVETELEGCGSAIVARTGYTGEDGFEVLLAPKRAAVLWNSLLARGVEPAGLGARDTLRLEARLCLYGNDIDETTNPLEAGLAWVVKMDKGDFIGRQSLLQIKENGLKRKLVGFEMIEPGVARHGYTVIVGGRPVGQVTSGAMSPTLGKAIGLAYLPLTSAEVGVEFSVDIRGKLKRACVVKTPFYKRGRVVV